MVRKYPVYVDVCVDKGGAEVFITINDEDVGAFGESGDSSLLDWEEICGAAVRLSHF